MAKKFIVNQPVIFDSFEEAAKYAKTLERTAMEKREEDFCIDVGELNKNAASPYDFEWIASLDSSVGLDFKYRNEKNPYYNQIKELLFGK